MDDLDRLYVELVDAIRRERPTSLAGGFTVHELTERLIPYRSVRNPVGFRSHDEYESTLSRLVAGERGYLLSEGEMQDIVRAGIEESLPDTRRYLGFPTAKLWLNPEEIPPPGDTRYAPPEVQERSLRDIDVVDIEVLTPDEDSSADPAAGPETPLADPPPLLGHDDESRARLGAEPTPAGTDRSLCRRCEARLPADAAFCPFCGQSTGIGVCRACGAELEVAWQFCAQCGAPRAERGPS